MRARLDNLPPASGGVPAPVPNYEAKQSPLAYAVLAVADFALASQRLLFRVWCLRLLCALASVAASIFVASRLARQLGMTEEFGQAAVCVLLSSQMFYATTAHIANDWLAIPLSALVVSLAIDLYRAPAMGSALRFALSLAAGLLTKASFLAFVPFAAGVVIWLAATRRLSARQVVCLLWLGRGICATFCSTAIWPGSK